MMFEDLKKNLGKSCEIRLEELIAVSSSTQDVSGNHCDEQRTSRIP